MALQLPDVTLAIIDTSCHAISKIVADDCIQQVDFGDIVVVSDVDLEVKHSRFINCGILDRNEVLRFRWKYLHKLINTSHALIVEWDANIIDPFLWTDEFLRYDYCGAPWEYGGKSGVVGNGGFSLRSHKLLSATSSAEMSDAECGGEDAALCIGYYRNKLEAEGCRWAPVALARRFSVTDIEDANKKDYRLYHPFDLKSFGFHGIYNWPRAYDRNKTDALERLLTPYARYKVDYERYRNVLHR